MNDSHPAQPIPADCETRNGIRLLPVQPNAAPVTPELVPELREQSELQKLIDKLTP